MSKNLKIILYISLAVVLILVGRSIYLLTTSLCCAPPDDQIIGGCEVLPTPELRAACKEKTIGEDKSENVVSGENFITSIKDYNNLKIVYGKSTGSLPPPYYRREEFTILTDSLGIATAEYIARDYEKVLERRGVNVSSGQLGDLISAAAKITPKAEGDRDLPCPGSSNESVTISQNGNVLLSASANSCGGDFDYESFSELVSEIDNLINK